MKVLIDHTLSITFKPWIDLNEVASGKCLKVKNKRAR